MLIDPRITKLADTLVNYSCAVRAGEKLLIEAVDVPDAFTTECIRVAHQAGAVPLVKLESGLVNRALMMHGSQHGWQLVADAERFLMDRVNCYIGARGSRNISELSDVPPGLHRHYESTVWKQVHLQSRCTRTRWVVLRWPSPAMAQAAAMSTEGLEDFFFKVCTANYAKMAVAMKPLVERLTRAEEIRVVGPGATDLSFSVAGMGALADDGKHNIPGGEVCTAPVRDSANGVIHYNTPSECRGMFFYDVRLTLKDGKIVDASASDSRRLNDILDADPGARYIGEFAFGLNPYCTRAIRDGLFDEKIAGSIHLALGDAVVYDGAVDNGNRSDIHWDLVLQQTPDAGGGAIYLDDELIREDGLFAADDLEPLNPENLRW
ncbi:MAG: aminopeptidase [Phycisphaerae bacterium]|jgi:aminopeptidase